MDWPSIPRTWLVKLGIKLLVEEVLALEEGGFKVQQGGALSSQWQFQVFWSMPPPRSQFPIHTKFPDSHHSFQNNYQICRTLDILSIKHRNMWLSVALMNDYYISKIHAIPYPRYRCVIFLATRKDKSYCVSFTDYPTCTCPNFVKMALEALGKKQQWKYCKHVYYILRYLYKMDYKEDLFMHASNYSFNEVMHILKLANIVEQAWEVKL